jgi:hypothetical protein
MKAATNPLGYCAPRDATPAERMTIRQAANDIRDTFAFYSMVPLIYLAMAVITPRIKPDEEECGNCREPMTKCRCLRSDA